MSTGRQLADLVDQVLDGRYRVLRLIAEGGMSAVYEAEQINVARRVAIKILKPEISTDPDMLARFRAEARIISELRHPNTLKLIDYGATDDDLLYLVTELLSGEPLSLRLKRGPMSPRETLHVLREVLRSLNEAHERGVIHRDLKPGNLFLEEVAGQTLVKVLDFGIAKMKVAKAGDPEQPATADGMLLGTPAYLSPEQAEGHTVDARSDIYSLGAVAYHCLSGGIPFPGEAVAQIMAHVTRPPTPFDELDPPRDVPEPLAQLVYRWMEKKPSKRPKSAQAAFDEATEVRDQLFGSDGTSAHRVAAPSSSSSVWVAVIGLGITVGLLVGAFQLSNGPVGGGRDASISARSDAEIIVEEPDASTIDDGGTDVDAQLAADAGLAFDDAGVPALRTGLQILRRPLSGTWSSRESVLGVLSQIEPLALDCFRRTQPKPSAGREIALTFVVRAAGVSVRVLPADEAGRAFRRCLSFRLPRTLDWPARESASTAGLILGEPAPSP